jgi:hypothetical protein
VLEKILFSSRSYTSSLPEGKPKVIGVKPILNVLKK